MAKTSPQRSPMASVRIILVLSLALNLLFIGLIAGSVWKWRSGDGPPRSVEFSMGPLGRALEPDHRRAVSNALGQAQGDRRPPSPREMRVATQGLIELLRADPFDEDAFAAALDEVGRHARDLQSAGQQAFIGVVAKMTPAERSAFADRVESQASRGPDAERTRKSR